MINDDLFSSYANLCAALLQLRRLGAGLPQWSLLFNPWLLRVRFVMDELSLEQVSLLLSSFPPLNRLFTVAAYSTTTGP